MGPRWEHHRRLEEQKGNGQHDLGGRACEKEAEKIQGQLCCWARAWLAGSTPVVISSRDVCVFVVTELDIPWERLF